MSATNMQKFFEKVGQGGDIRKRAETAAGLPLQTLVAMDLQQADGHLKRLIDFAGKEGYGFTRDELVTAFRQQVADVQKRAAGGELTDSDLASVAGGGPGGWIVGAVVGGLIGAGIGGALSGGLGAGAGAIAGAGLGGDAASNIQDFAKNHNWGNW